jgi:hypothetical protein
VTKKSDMSSRYAAAHARREQRKREAPSREYLPLAEDIQIETQGNSGFGDRLRTSGRGTAVLTSRLPAIDYSYLRGDLIRTFVLAGSLFIVMIVLSFIIK